MATSGRGVFAAGDVTGPTAVHPAADEMGQISTAALRHVTTRSQGRDDPLGAAARVASGAVDDGA